MDITVDDIDKHGRLIFVNNVGGMVSWGLDTDNLSN